MVQSTAQKLGIKPGSTMLVAGSPAATVRGLLGELPAGAELVEAAESADLALVFTDEIADVLADARPAYDRVGAAGRCWIAYRKGATRRPAQGAEPLHRDTLQRALAQVGLDGVTLVSLNDEWSAMRVKAVAAVGAS